MTLAEHIAEINKGLSGFKMVEDPEYWNEYGIFTPEQFDRYMLISTAWGKYKDVYGVRPRHVNFDNMSNQDIRDFIEGIR